MLQLFLNNQYGSLSGNPTPGADVFFSIILSLLVILAIGSLSYLVSIFTRNIFKIAGAFDRVVLQIQVPKERKSEGTGQNPQQEDRLEHIKEEIGITETLFATIAGLRAERGVLSWFRGRSDHLSFELVVHNSLIYFYVAVPHKLRNFLEQQIHAQYPYAHIEEMSDYNIFGPQSTVLGSYLAAKKTLVFPFKTYKSMDSDPLSSLLNALSRVREENSSVAVQYIIRSAKRSWRRQGVYIVREVKKGEKFERVAHRSRFMQGIGKSGKAFREVVLSSSNKDHQSMNNRYQLSSMEEEMLKGIEQKLSKGGLDMTIRVVSASDNENTARLNLENILNSFSQFNLYRYGNEFGAIMPRNQKKIIQEFIYRSFHEHRKTLVNTEEMAGLWHLPLHSTEAPNIKWLSGRTAPPPSNVANSGLLLGHVKYRGIDTSIFIKEADRRRHLYIIGKSGTGKSVLIQNLAIQDIQNDKGVCVVDPHGDLVEDVLKHVPKHRADDVVIFNPSDLERPIGLNMLEAKTEDQKDFAVQEMISIFYKLFPPEMIGPMFEHNMRNVMLTLMADLNDPGTIIDIPRMFTDNAYVKKYLVKLKDPVVRAFWEKEMAQTSDFHKSEMLGYLISKVGRFVENEMMRNIMGQQKSGFNFRELMDEEKILLVNLSKGTTGEVNAKLLGLIVVAKLQMAAMARASTDEEHRKDFYLYIDEFQNFVTDSISTILSEARKYRLDLIIAHQYMGQLTDDKGKSAIRDAVLGNVGTMCVGRIGPEDADILAKEFAPVFGSYDLLNPQQFSYYTKLLIDNETAKPFSMLSYPPKPGNKELGEAIKQLSRLKYGRDRGIVEAEILERTKLGGAEKSGKTDMIEASL
ncbi:MAG: type IV secretory system conjugative DNA transfer family protein [Candidatus Magasanikbacteria bacterium]|nr:type IV secretory system conjugative DNA transfer family protein [Candidatus Magasanikbacteria bacterium]